MNELILSSSTSTDPFDAQPIFVFALPLRDAEEPFLETDKKETVS